MRPAAQATLLSEFSEGESCMSRNARIGRGAFGPLLRRVRNVLSACACERLCVSDLQCRAWQYINAPGAELRDCNLRTNAILSADPASISGTSPKPGITAVHWERKTVGDEITKYQLKLKAADSLMWSDWSNDPEELEATQRSGTADCGMRRVQGLAVQRYTDGKRDTYDFRALCDGGKWTAWSRDTHFGPRNATGRMVCPEGTYLYGVRIRRHSVLKLGPTNQKDIRRSTNSFGAYCTDGSFVRWNDWIPGDVRAREREDNEVFIGLPEVDGVVGVGEMEWRRWSDHTRDMYQVRLHSTEDGEWTPWSRGWRSNDSTVHHTGRVTCGFRQRITGLAFKRFSDDVSRDTYDFRALCEGGGISEWSHDWHPGTESANGEARCPIGHYLVAVRLQRMSNHVRDTYSFGVACTDGSYAEWRDWAPGRVHDDNFVKIELEADETCRCVAPLSPDNPAIACTFSALSCASGSSCYSRKPFARANYTKACAPVGSALAIDGPFLVAEEATPSKRRRRRRN